MKKSHKARTDNGNDINCCCNKKTIGCCRVEAVISVDGRGQAVLPKEIRNKMGIKAGDKLAVINLEKMGNCSCIILMKAADLEEKIKDMLGPLSQS